jgi:hypothetical protein
MRTYSQRIGKLIKRKRRTMYNQLQSIGLPLCSKTNPVLAVNLPGKLPLERKYELLMETVSLWEAVIFAPTGA